VSTGLLISDLGIWSLAREVVPGMALHVSTQANTTNYAAVRAWEKLGASRVVLARDYPWRKSPKSAPILPWIWKFSCTVPCVFPTQAAAG
jgi:hypothetical protein